jgi:hypothetical protein
MPGSTSEGARDPLPPRPGLFSSYPLVRLYDSRRVMESERDGVRVQRQHVQPVTESRWCGRWISVVGGAD